jgi:hypothetical protein
MEEFWIGPDIMKGDLEKFGAKQSGNRRVGLGAARKRKGWSLPYGVSIFALIVFAPSVVLAESSSTRSNDRISGQQKVLSLRGTDRAAYLRLQIGIAGTQAVAWTDYEQALELYQAEARRERQLELHKLLRMGGEPITEAERLDSEFRPNADSLQAKGRLRSAFQRLYSLLSPEQRLRADRLLTSGECGID